MNYKLIRKEVTVDAGEFVSLYRDVERIEKMCGNCPSYGKSWGCPPHVFDSVAVCDGFKTVRLMGTIIEFDEKVQVTCTSPEDAREISTHVMEEVWGTLLPEMYELERQTPGSRIFTFRCRLCPEGCTRPQGKPCRHPDSLRYSLESVGFDVVAATRDLLGIELEWSSDGSLPKHITLVTAHMLP